MCQSDSLSAKPKYAAGQVKAKVPIGDEGFHVGEGSPVLVNSRSDLILYVAVFRDEEFRDDTCATVSSVVLKVACRWVSDKTITFVLAMLVCR